MSVPTYATPKTKATAPTAEIGYAQSVHQNWWLYEPETTPELVWPQSVVVYDQMQRTDSQVTSVLRAMTLPVRRTPWRIDPNGARDEVVDFVADNLGLPVVGRQAVQATPRQKDRFSWDEHVRLALLMLRYGHMYFEQVYRVDPDGSRARLRKLGPRMPQSIERIDVAPDGGLVSISQWWTEVGGAPRPITVDRLVAYVHEREGGNWLGRSILRPAYKNWMLKDRLLRVQAQTIERNGMGIPLYKGQEDASEADLAIGLAMAKKWRSGEAAGSSVPFGADLVLRGVEGTLPDANPAIRYHDEQIGRAVLAHFLNLGTQTGSWALGTTFADFFTLSLQTLATQIADTATCHIVEDLVDINFGPSEIAPKITFDEIGSRQAATADAIAGLIAAGVFQADDRLEESLRQQYGLPPRDPDTARGGAADAAAPAGASPGEPVPDDPAEAFEVYAAAGEDDASEYDDDEAIEGLLYALEYFDAARVVRAAGADFDWDSTKHPRGKDGKFIKLGPRMIHAISKWAKAGKTGPHPLEGFNRKQLMSVAKQRGVDVPTGTATPKLKNMLLADIGGKELKKLSGAPDKPDDVTPDGKPDVTPDPPKDAPKPGDVVGAIDLLDLAADSTKATTVAYAVDVDADHKVFRVRAIRQPDGKIQIQEKGPPGAGTMWQNVGGDGGGLDWYVAKDDGQWPDNYAAKADEQVKVANSLAEKEAAEEAAKAAKKAATPEPKPKAPAPAPAATSGQPPIGSKKVPVSQTGGVTGVYQLKTSGSSTTGFSGAVAKQELEIYVGGEHLGSLKQYGYGWAAYGADGKAAGYPEPTKQGALKALFATNQTAAIDAADAAERAAKKAEAAKVKTAEEADLAALVPPADTKALSAAEQAIRSGDFSGLKQVSGKQGSNEGGIFEAPDGSRWYIKAQKSEEHAANEQLATAFYREAGIEIPEVIRGSGTPGLSGSHHTATRILDTAESNLKSRIVQADKGVAVDRKYLRRAHAGFAADVWLANWDVAGASFDNVVSIGDTPVRIDAGGSLLYRAKGAPKGPAFGPIATEWDTFTDTSSASTSAALFDQITSEDMIASAERVEAITPDRIRALVKEHGLPDSLADTLIERRKDILSRAAEERSKPKKPFAEGALEDEPALHAVPLTLKTAATHLKAVGESAEDAKRAYYSLSAYKGSAYVGINETLRGLQTGQGKYDGTSYSEHIERLDVAFARAALPADIVVYRGEKYLHTHFPPDVWSAVGGMEGMEWTEPGYASTSVGTSTPESFAGAGHGSSHGSQPTVMRIVVPKGTGAIALDSAAYGEAEVLLDRGLRYRVVKDNGVVGGRRRLDVMVVG